jgi:hypothetical protein
MSISEIDTQPRAMKVTVSDDELTVDLVDGRKISVPVVWFPRLLNASAAQREDWELIGEGEGIHWPQIDEDLSVVGILRGTRGSQLRPRV